MNKEAITQNCGLKGPERESQIKDLLGRSESLLSDFERILNVLDKRTESVRSITPTDENKSDSPSMNTEVGQRINTINRTLDEQIKRLYTITDQIDL